MKKTPKALTFDISDSLPTTVASIELKRLEKYVSSLIRPDAIAWKAFLKDSDNGIVYGLHEQVKDLKYMVIIDEESASKLLNAFDYYLETKLPEHVSTLVPDYELSEDIVNKKISTKLWKVTLEKFAGEREAEYPSVFVATLSEAYSVIELLGDNTIDVKFCLGYSFNKVRYHVFVGSYRITLVSEYEGSFKDGRFCA